MPNDDVVDLVRFCVADDLHDGISERNVEVNAQTGHACPQWLQYQVTMLTLVFNHRLGFDVGANYGHLRHRRHVQLRVVFASEVSGKVERPLAASDPL